MKPFLQPFLQQVFLLCFLLFVCLTILQSLAAAKPLSPLRPAPQEHLTVYNPLEGLSEFTFPHGAIAAVSAVTILSFSHLANVFFSFTTQFQNHLPQTFLSSAIRRCASAHVLTQQSLEYHCHSFLKGGGYVLRTFVFSVLSTVLAHKYSVCGIEVLVLMIILYREDVTIEKGDHLQMYTCLDCVTYSHIRLGGWHGVGCLITKGDGALLYPRQVSYAEQLLSYHLVIWQEHLLPPVYK